MTHAARFLCLFLGLVGACVDCTDGSEVPVPTGLHINYEPNEQLAATAPLMLGWALPPPLPSPAPAPPPPEQQSFELRLQNATTGALILQRACVPSPTINC